MSARSKDRMGLSRRYAAALKKRLAGKDGVNLRPAESLGREALSARLDTLDLVKIHERALLALLPSGPASGSRDGMLRCAASFFAAALAPIGDAHRAALKNNGRLHRRIATLRLRNVELAATRRRLKRALDRSKALKHALGSSERHSAHLLKTSHRMQQKLRRLTHEILVSQEEERRRISRELHDEIGQSLTAINVTLATLCLEATANTAGLLGMRERVKMIGGGFSVESERGEGTTIRATIPPDELRGRSPVARVSP